MTEKGETMQRKENISREILKVLEKADDFLINKVFQIINKDKGLKCCI